MFAVPGGVVLPLTCSEAYHGEASSDLYVYKITGDRVSQVGHRARDRRRQRWR